MSRHTFRQQVDGKTLKVVMGFDRPFQKFFMTIVDETIHHEDEEVFVYDNLSDNRLDPLTGMSNSLSIFLDEASVHGITIPQEMVEEIKEDSLHNIGIKYVTHYAAPYRRMITKE